MAFIRATSPHRELLGLLYSNVAEGSLNEGRKILLERDELSPQNFFFFPVSLCFRSSAVSSCLFFFFFSCDSPFRSTFDYVNLLVTVRFHNSFPRCLTLLCNYRYLVYQFPLVLCRKNYSISFFVSDWIKFWVNNRILKNYIFFLFFKDVFNLFHPSILSLEFFWKIIHFRKYRCFLY